MMEIHLMTLRDKKFINIMAASNFKFEGYYEVCN